MCLHNTLKGTTSFFSFAISEIINSKIAATRPGNASLLSRRGSVLFVCQVFLA